MIEKFVKFVRTYFIPRTLEQSLGAGYLVMANSLIQRPYMAGVDNLYAAYGILISPRAVGAILSVFALILIQKKTCGRRLFIVLYLPIPIYAWCLLRYFYSNPNVGFAGTLGFIGLSIALARMYARRATQREIEEENQWTLLT